MELKNMLTPWNWFKKEEEQTKNGSKHLLSKSNDHNLNRLQYELDSLLDHAFQGFPSWSSRSGNGQLERGLIMPQVDIAESQKDYTVTMEVAGVQEKDIDLTVLDGTLTIRGEKRSEQEKKDKHYHRIERSYGSFQRMLSLPTDADEQAIRAKFKDGILTITIAKDPKAKPAVRKISIG